MPIRIQNDLPAKEILEKENIFVMDETRALSQEIRPLKVGILNLMPLKEDTELQLLRSFSNTPLQVDVTFITVKTHESKNTDKSHLNKFYQTFDEVRKKRFDGLDTSLEHRWNRDENSKRWIAGQRASRDLCLVRVSHVTCCLISFCLGGAGGASLLLWAGEGAASRRSCSDLYTPPCDESEGAVW